MDRTDSTPLGTRIKWSQGGFCVETAVWFSKKTDTASAENDPGLGFYFIYWHDYSEFMDD